MQILHYQAKIIINRCIRLSFGSKYFRIKVVASPSNMCSKSSQQFVGGSVECLPIGIGRYQAIRICPFILHVIQVRALKCCRSFFETFPNLLRKETPSEESLCTISAQMVFHSELSQCVLIQDICVYFYWNWIKSEQKYYVYFSIIGQFDFIIELNSRTYILLPY